MVVIDHATATQLSYDDIIGCEEAKKNLKRILSLSDPSKAKLRKHFNIHSSGGALLYGPPGTVACIFPTHAGTVKWHYNRLDTTPSLFWISL